MVNTTYNENDVAPVFIDGLVKVIAGVTIFASLIGLAFGLLIVWLVARKLMGRR